MIRILIVAECGTGNPIGNDDSETSTKPLPLATTSNTTNGKQTSTEITLIKSIKSSDFLQIKFFYLYLSISNCMLLLYLFIYFFFLSGEQISLSFAF